MGISSIILVSVVIIGLMTNPQKDNQDLPVSSISNGENLNITTTGIPGLTEQKIYEIPSNQQKDSYSVEDFKLIYSQYLKLNNLEEQTTLENDKTGMSQEEKLKCYTIYEITPPSVRAEIKCQLFKVNSTCETYLIYNSKVYHIGLGFGGMGLISIETCDFDGNNQKDLIYTFSWGSGLHRSHIGIFNFSNEHEEWLDFKQPNEDIMLEKVSDDDFNVHIAKLYYEELEYTHLKPSKQEKIADVKAVNGKIGIVKF
jgi:hypothetical protein